MLNQISFSGHVSPRCLYPRGCQGRLPFLLPTSDQPHCIMYHVTCQLYPIASLVPQGQRFYDPVGSHFSLSVQCLTFPLSATSFPILLCIAWYERQAKRAGSITFYETVSAAAEKVFDTLPRSLKRLSMSRLIHLAILLLSDPTSQHSSKV